MPTNLYLLSVSFSFSWHIKHSKERKVSSNVNAINFLLLNALGEGKEKRKEKGKNKKELCMCLFMGRECGPCSLRNCPWIP